MFGSFEQGLEEQLNLNLTDLILEMMKVAFVLIPFCGLKMGLLQNHRHLETENIVVEIIHLFLSQRQIIYTLHFTVKLVQTL